jgi:hypothetical protein
MDWKHSIWIIIIAYILGYYFPQLAAMTVGKLKPASR